MNFYTKQVRACLVAQTCLTLSDPMDCSLRASSVLGILQARILEGVAISFSMGSSLLRDRTRVSLIVGGFFTTEPRGKPKAAPGDSKIRLIFVSQVSPWRVC